VPPRATFRIGCPGATRTRDTRSRKAVLCSTELRDRNGQGGWIRTNGLLRPRQALLARLSYTLLALRREIESLSPDRQSGRLTRCVTEREYGAPFFAEASKGILRSA
jgi:hypothetical protein